MSYHTDADSNVMEDGTFDGLNKVDRKALSAAMLCVDVTEVHSPERVAQVAKRFGLSTGPSMDLTNSWNFNRNDHKRQAWSKIGEEAQRLLIGSTPCTNFSDLQELNEAVAGEVRLRDGQGHQARRILLCPVQVADTAGTTFSPRTSMDG